SAHQFSKSLKLAERGRALLTSSGTG
ncbi:hypothetical protein CISIN_1g0391381mg, partial [Citrus sinensis]